MLRGFQDEGLNFFQCESRHAGKFIAIDRGNGVPVGFRDGGHEQIAFTDGSSFSFQFSPKLRVSPGFGERERQRDVILQQSFHKPRAAFANGRVICAGATVEQFGRSNGGDEEGFVGMRGKKTDQIKPFALGGISTELSRIIPMLRPERQVVWRARHPSQQPVRRLRRMADESGWAKAWPVPPRSWVS